MQPGYFADLTVFDPATVKDESTYAEPHRYPTGIPYVVVNGAVVVDDGRMGAARPGPDPDAEIARSRALAPRTLPPSGGSDLARKFPRRTGATQR